MQQVLNRGVIDRAECGPFNTMSELQQKKEHSLHRMKQIIKISRSLMEFLKTEGEGEGSRGMARAFLFDNLLKSLILIVDEVIGTFEKYAKEQVA